MFFYFTSIKLSVSFEIKKKYTTGIQPYSVPMFIVVFIIIIGLPTVGTETQIHKTSYY